MISASEYNANSQKLPDGIDHECHAMVRIEWRAMRRDVRHGHVGRADESLMAGRESRQSPLPAIYGKSRFETDWLPDSNSQMSF
jgi:hypothetical protein